MRASKTFLQVFCFGAFLHASAYAADSPEPKVTVGKDDAFLLSIEPPEKGLDDLVAKVILKQAQVDGSAIPDCTIFWVTPDGRGMSIPVHPVTDELLAGKISGPFQSGTHHLVVNLAIRNRQGLLQVMCERQYELEFPTLLLGAQAMRQFSTAQAPPRATPQPQKSAGEEETTTGGKAGPIIAATVFVILTLAGVVVMKRGGHIRRLRQRFARAPNRGAVLATAAPTPEKTKNDSGDPAEMTEAAADAGQAATEAAAELIGSAEAAESADLEKMSF